MSETGADDDDKKTIASSTKATASTRSTVTVGEFAEGDFIDERDSSSRSPTPPRRPTTKSSRARRNWSMFSNRLRNTFKNGQSSSTRQSIADRQSLILFDIASPSDCCPCPSLTDIQIPDCTWIAERRPNDSGIPHRHRIRRPVSQMPELLYKFISPEPDFSLKSLSRGFDNTGNVKIWPGSEGLGYCILQTLKKDPDFCKEQKILELGSGFLALSSFILAKLSKGGQFYITDGNKESIRSIERIRTENPSVLKRNMLRIKAFQMFWGDSCLPFKFDVILAADCVFFSETHSKFLKSIQSHLGPESVCYISSPHRKGSLRKFMDLVEKEWPHFQMEMHKEWNDILEDKLRGAFKNDEDKDENFPIILTIRLRKTSEETSETSETSETAVKV